MTTVSSAISTPRLVRAPRGTELSCKGWQQEAALRMLMNNLDPEVAEHPEDLVVYGGTGRAARSWEAFDAIVRTLRGLEADETMLVQSGKPVGVFRTHEWAPRVLIANSNLVGDWANWEHFRKLEAEGLMMYGQMTAGSWIYIGTQGILQGTYETFGAVAKKRGLCRHAHTLAGTITLTAGLGGMGGAQPLAVTMNEGVAICVDCDVTRIDRRIEHRYLDTKAADIDDALRLAIEARDAKRPLSIGLLGNAAEVLPELLRRNAPIDIVTDQTSAHDPLAYLPVGIDFDDMKKMAEKDPIYFTEQAQESMAKHVAAMVGFMDRGAEVFDYGNSIRDEARKAGYDRAFDFPGFVPAYIRPQFEEGLGPFRWVALSGDPKDIAATDRAILELFPDNKHLTRWITMAGEKVAFEGLPARICWLGYGERHLAGLKFNEMVASGELSAPIVIGRDHLDSGSVASPYRETEAMLDGSDAIADWPLLNALVNTASGASWVSIHHGGGVGIGRSIHAGQVTVADGTELAAQKLARVLTNDPGMGVIRHVDAGYEHAADIAASAACESHAGERMTAFDTLWPTILDVGRHTSTGGYRRYAWSDADLTLREWFSDCAAQRGMDVEEDRNGNLWAWWMPPGWTGDPTDAFVTGSHLDSVPDGGAFDGPLGVVSAFAAIDIVRERGVVPRVPVARGRLLRRGGGAVRRCMRRLPAVHRCVERREGPRAAGRPRCDPRRGDDEGGPQSPSTSASTRSWPTASASSSNCTSSRAARWIWSTARSPSLRPSGRTGAGSSRSAARRTTQAPPGWPTGTTRCSRSHPRCTRRGRWPPPTTRSRRSARSSLRPTAPTRFRRRCTPGSMPGPPTRRRCGRWSTRSPPKRGSTPRPTASNSG